MLKTVILAGGLGGRLKPFTNILPKPLIPISGEKTVLEIQINYLAKNGFRDIYIATNYKSELIESYLGDGSKYNVNLIFSKETKRLGTCGPLSLLKDQLTEPFILMNGDVLTETNLLKFYEFSLKRDSLLTVATKEIIRPFDFGNVLVKNNKIVKIKEKPVLKFLIVAGIYFMKPEIFNFIPNNQYFGIDNLIKIMIEKKLDVSSYLIKEYWVDIGRFEELNDVVENYKGRE